MRHENEEQNRLHKCSVKIDAYKWDPKVTVIVSES